MVNVLFKNTANILSISRVLLAPCFILTFFYDNDVDFTNNHFVVKLVSLIIVICSSISDGLDGYYARKQNKVTMIGIYLDPFADKVFNITIFLCFLSSGIASTWMVAIIYFRESAIESLRTLAAKQGKAISTRRSGKWKTGIQMGGIITILFGFVIHDIISIWFQNQFLTDLLYKYVPYVGIFIITTVTVLSGIDYLYHFWFLFKSKNCNENT